MAANTLTLQELERVILEGVRLGWGPIPVATLIDWRPHDWHLCTPLCSVLLTLPRVPARTWATAAPQCRMALCL
jgi:hypothetical protein